MPEEVAEVQWQCGEDQDANAGTLVSGSHEEQKRLERRSSLSHC